MRTLKTPSFLMLAFFAMLLFACGTSKTNKEEATESTETTESTTSTKRFVRKNANTPEAAKDLAALQVALDSMRKMDCSQTSSWYYQGAMHWVPTSLPNNPFCESYHKSPGDLKTAWDNCTHAPNSESNFLLWHRLYIAHFERIVRKLSGYQDFALPYWGYTDTTNVAVNRRMPQIYQDKTKSLYEVSRFDSLNNNYPVQGGILPALNLTDLFENTDFLLFTSNIDTAPHGAMHGYIGGGFNDLSIYNPIYQKPTEGGLMGHVPSAAFDPIFWAHHSNIDRVWQQWTNSPNGSLVTLKDLQNQPWKYTFFDENGKEVNYTTQQVYDMIYKVDYDYDDTPTASEGVKSKSSLFLAVKSTADTMMKSKIGKKVSTGQNLKFVIQNPKKKDVKLLSTENATGKLVIMTVTVSFVKEPKGMFEVYVNLPDGAKRDQKSDYFAGYMTFFGAEHHATAHASGGHDGMKMDMPMKLTKKFIFDMTKEFNNTKALNKSNLNVSIFKSAGKVKDEIVIEDVSFSTH